MTALPQLPSLNLHFESSDLISTFFLKILNIFISFLYVHHVDTWNLKTCLITENNDCITNHMHVQFDQLVQRKVFALKVFVALL